jgi:hypothetical protein
MFRKNDGPGHVAWPSSKKLGIWLNNIVDVRMPTTD